MSEGDLPGIAARTALEAARDAPLGDEARALLVGETPPGRYLNALVGRGLFPDAVRFLAHALPKREAVWWACVCVRESVAAASPPAAASAALNAAGEWTASPDEPNRRSAGAAAEAAGVGTPAGLAAMAAFWSGGSLAPAGLPDVPPPDHLSARGVAGAVVLAAVAPEPEKAPERFRRFLAHGVDVASGANRWPAAASAASAPAPPSPSSPVPTAPPPASRPAPTSTRRLDTWE